MRAKQSTRDDHRLRGGNGPVYHRSEYRAGFGFFGDRRVQLDGAAEKFRDGLDRDFRQIARLNEPVDLRAYLHGLRRELRGVVRR